MDTQNRRAESHTSSTDPIAAVTLWSVLLPLIGASLVSWVLLGQSYTPEREKNVKAVVTFAALVAWWLWVIAGATRHAGYRASIPSLGAVLKLSSKVALAGIMVNLLWTLLDYAFGLPRLGLVAAPGVLTSERTAQSFAYTVFLAALLGPVAEEMVFRGALFRKWRLLWGAGKAAVLTSLLFGLGHVNPITSGLHALAWAVLYTNTRTLWAPIVAHAMNNLLAVTLAGCLRLLPPALLREAVTDWRLQLASAVPALLGTWWLVRFVCRGWHTLGDPVHGEPASVPAPAAVGSCPGA
jgi:membrane protease YdiL (CAAX protease family)